MMTSMQRPPAGPADLGKAAFYPPQAARDLPAWLLAAMSGTRRPEIAAPPSSPSETGAERAWSCQADDAEQPPADRRP